MKKIPKLGINNYIYKTYTIKDVIIISFFILMTAAFISSKNKILMILSVVNLILAFIFMLKINQDRMYMIFLYKIQYSFGKQIYKNDLNQFKKLINYKQLSKNGDVLLCSGGYAQVWEIGEEKIFSFDDTVEQVCTEYYNLLYNSVSTYGKFKIVKININKDYQEAINNRNVICSEVSDLKEKIIQQEKIILDKFQNDPKMKVSSYYLVYYAPTIEKLHTIENEIINIVNKYELTFTKITNESVINKILIEQNLLYNQHKNIYDIKKIIFGDSSINISNKKKYIVTIDNLSGDVPFGYLREVFNLDGVSITINVQVEDSLTAINKMDRTVMDYSADIQRTSVSSKVIVFEEEIEAINNIIRDVKNGDDSFFKIHISIICDDINQRKYVLAELRNLGIRCSIRNSRIKREFNFHQLLNLQDIKEKDRPIYMSSSLLAYSYPFIIKATNDLNGEILGVGCQGDLAVVDFNKRGYMYTNSNIVIVGKAGSGKSYLTKSLVASFLCKGEHVYILDPENEYQKMAQKLGGTIIDLASDDFSINPLDPLTRFEEFNFEEHLNFLDSFFHNIFKLKEEEIELLNRSVIRLFLKFNIGEDNNLLNSNDFPIFSDLEEQIRIDREEDLSNRDYYDRILIQMLKCTKGRYAKLWNKHTEIKTKNSFIVFNFQNIFATMNVNFAMAQMQLVSKYLNNRLIENYNKIINKEVPNRLNIIVDEAHRFIDEENRVALKMMYVFAKQCRKYGCKLITITQSIADFLSTKSILKESKALISETQYLFLFSMSPQHINDIRILFENSSLSQAELDTIRAQHRGECMLISSNKEKECVRIILNEEVLKII